MNTAIIKIILLGETGWKLRNMISQNSGRRVESDILYEDECIACIQIKSEYPINIDRFAKKVFNRIAYPTNNYWTINMIENPIRFSWDPTVMDNEEPPKKDPAEIETEVEDLIPILDDLTFVDDCETAISNDNTIEIQRPKFNKKVELKTIKSSLKSNIKPNSNNRSAVYSEPGWKFL